MEEKLRCPSCGRKLKEVNEGEANFYCKKCGYWLIIWEGYK